jgi:hypothetical protein
MKNIEPIHKNVEMKPLQNRNDLSNIYRNPKKTEHLTYDAIDEGIYFDRRRIFELVLLGLYLAIPVATTVVGFTYLSRTPLDLIPFSLIPSGFLIWFIVIASLIIVYKKIDNLFYSTNTPTLAIIVPYGILLTLITRGIFVYASKHAQEHIYLFIFIPIVLTGAVSLALITSILLSKMVTIKKWLALSTLFIISLVFMLFSSN